jgi:serine/threonine protein kinase
MDESPRTPRSENISGDRLDKDNIKNQIFFSKYRAIKKLGEGSFGKVYKGEYNGEYYALKFESREDGDNLLENEATIMNYLQGPHIPKIKTFGFNKDYNILVMQLLGKSLEDLINIKLKFSIKTTAMLGYQMLSVLQYIHDRHIIHRDIKPDNFVMGYGDKNARLYLLDFGLAKKYRSSRTLIQYPYVKKKKLTGTARYASIHALEEMEQSRRDDLEATGYVLMYFLRGSLPWQGLKIKTKDDRYKKILDKKKETTSSELCKDFPEEFKHFVDYTRNLGYNENPKYEKLKYHFICLIREKMNENFDFVYDWTTKTDLKKRESSNDVNMILDEKDQLNDECFNKSVKSSKSKKSKKNEKSEKNSKTEKKSKNKQKEEKQDVGKSEDKSENNQDKNKGKEKEKDKNEDEDSQNDNDNEDKAESNCCLM